MLEKFLTLWLYGWSPWVPFAVVLGILSGADVVRQILKSGDPAWAFGSNARPSRKTSFGIVVFVVGYLAWPLVALCYLAPPVWKFLSRPCLTH